MVNFYRVDGQFHFVDLPGYGFARVPKEVAGQWKQLIEQYLLQRRSLELCFLILDARRGWMEKDLELKEWLEFHNRRYLVIATKTDKLKSQKEQRQGRGHPEPISGSCEPLPFSAVKMPGSEGNLASDLENQDPAAVAAPTTDEPSEPTATGKKAEVRKAIGKAAEPKAVPRRKPAEPKADEATGD